MTSAAARRLLLLAGAVRSEKPAPTGEPAVECAYSTAGPTVTQTLEDHLGAVYRYALRLTGRTDLAEDLAQETMLRAIRSWRRLRDERMARVWLLRIATNAWTDHLRKAKFRPRLLAEEPVCGRPTLAAALDDRENVARALAAMETLPPRQRQVLYLVTCEQLSQDDVAAVLGIDKSSVKANLSLGRKAMRQRLREVYLEVCGGKLCREQ